LLEELRTRTGVLLAASSLAASFLGQQAFRESVPLSLAVVTPLGVNQQKTRIVNSCFHLCRSWPYGRDHVPSRFDRRYSLLQDATRTKIASKRRPSTSPAADTEPRSARDSGRGVRRFLSQAPRQAQEEKVLTSLEKSSRNFTFCAQHVATFRLQSCHHGGTAEDEHLERRQTR